MADISRMLADGLAFLTEQLKAHASEPITYSRGADSVDVLAVIQVQILKLDDGMGGFRVEYTDLEACIATTDLSFDRVTIVEPRRGDLIHRVMPYDVQVFEVLPMDSTDACWRWSDALGQTMRRVRAKLIDTEESYA